jgi:hypothetical protein
MLARCLPDADPQANLRRRDGPPCAPMPEDGGAPRESETQKRLGSSRTGGLGLRADPIRRGGIKDSIRNSARGGDFDVESK